MGHADTMTRRQDVPKFGNCTLGKLVVEKSRGFQGCPYFLFQELPYQENAMQSTPENHKAGW